MTRRSAIVVFVSVLLMACSRPASVTPSDDARSPEPSTTSAPSTPPALPSTSPSIEDTATPSVGPFDPGVSGSILVVRIDEAAGGLLVTSIAPDGTETIAGVVPSLADTLGEWRIATYQMQFLVGMSGILVAAVERGDIDDLADYERGTAVIELAAPTRPATLLPAGRVTVAPGGEIVLDSFQGRTIRRITDLMDPDGIELAIPDFHHVFSAVIQTIPLLADGSGVVVVTTLDDHTDVPAVLLWDGTIQPFDETSELFLPTGTERPFGRGGLQGSHWSETSASGGSTGFAVQGRDHSRSQIVLENSSGGDDVWDAVWSPDGAVLHLTGNDALYRWPVNDPVVVRVADLAYPVSGGHIAALAEQSVTVSTGDQLEIVDLRDGSSTLVKGYAAGVVP